MISSMCSPFWSAWSGNYDPGVVLPPAIPPREIWSALSVKWSLWLSWNLSNSLECPILAWPNPSLESSQLLMFPQCLQIPQSPGRLINPALTSLICCCLGSDTTDVIRAWCFLHSPLSSYIVLWPKTMALPHSCPAADWGMITYVLLFSHFWVSLICFLIPLLLHNWKKSFPMLVYP